MFSSSGLSSHNYSHIDTLWLMTMMPICEQSYKLFLAKLKPHYTGCTGLGNPHLMIGWVKVWMILWINSLFWNSKSKMNIYLIKREDHTDLIFGGNTIRGTLQLCQKCWGFGDFHCFFWVVTGADGSHKPEILEPSSIRILTRGYRW